MSAQRHIVAMGGGGFAMERSPLLDDYILWLADTKRPCVCFIPTASGDSVDYVERFHRAFATRARTSDLALFNRSARDLRRQLLDQHVLYVGGGNTANMLAVWRVHGVDKIIREAWQRGIVCAGVSAGMICWFQSGVTDSFGGLAPLDDGLGLLRGSACPHFDGERHRRASYARFIRDGLAPGYAADDGAALHFIGTKLEACVASRRNAKAYRVEQRNGRVVAVPLATSYLGTFKVRTS